MGDYRDERNFKKPGSFKLSDRGTGKMDDMHTMMDRKGQKLTRENLQHHVRNHFGTSEADTKKFIKHHYEKHGLLEEETMDDLNEAKPEFDKKTHQKGYRIMSKDSFGNVSAGTEMTSSKRALMKAHKKYHGHDKGTTHSLTKVIHSRKNNEYTTKGGEKDITRKIQKEETNMATSKDIVDHLYNGDLDRMRDAFAQAMLPEIANVLETKRLDVAYNLIGQEAVREDDTVEGDDLQEISAGKLMRYVSKAGRDPKKDREKGIEKAGKKLGLDKDD